MTMCLLPIINLLTLELPGDYDTEFLGHLVKELNLPFMIWTWSDRMHCIAIPSPGALSKSNYKWFTLVRKLPQHIISHPFLVEWFFNLKIFRR